MRRVVYRLIQGLERISSEPAYFAAGANGETRVAQGCADEALRGIPDGKGYGFQLYYEPFYRYIEVFI